MPDTANKDNNKSKDNTGLKCGIENSGFLVQTLVYGGLRGWALDSYTTIRRGVADIALNVQNVPERRKEKRFYHQIRIRPNPDQTNSGSLTPNPDPTTSGPLPAWPVSGQGIFYSRVYC